MGEFALLARSFGCGVRRFGAGFRLLLRFEAFGLLLRIGAFGLKLQFGVFLGGLVAVGSLCGCG